MRNPPRNVESCFTQALHKVGGMYVLPPRILVLRLILAISTGGSATVSIQKWTGVPRLSLDIAGAVRFVRSRSSGRYYSDEFCDRNKEEEITEATGRLQAAKALLAESNASQAQLTHEQKHYQVCCFLRSLAKSSANAIRVPRARSGGRRTRTSTSATDWKSFETRSRNRTSILISKHFSN